jgi:hypothetical protein
MSISPDADCPTCGGTCRTFGKVCDHSAAGPESAPAGQINGEGGHDALADYLNKLPAVAWAVTTPRGGIHKLSITRDSADRKAAKWREEWPDNRCSVRPLVFGDATAAPTYWNSQRKMIERAIIGLRDGWASKKDADDALAVLAATPAAAAPQQAVPEGYALVPLRMNAAMRRITDEEGWQWEDLLAAADAITEVEYNEIAAAPVAANPQGPEGWDAAKLAYIKLTNSAEPTDSGGATYRADAQMMAAFDAVFAAPVAAIEQTQTAGMHAAAAFIEKRAEDYLNNNTESEHDTGAIVWRYGDAGRDYHGTLVELAEELRSAAPSSPGASAQAAPDAVRIKKLEKALRPFAKLAKAFEGNFDTDKIMEDFRGVLTIRHIREADRALRTQPPADSQNGGA